MLISEECRAVIVSSIGFPYVNYGTFVSWLQWFGNNMDTSGKVE
jgi:hypothetical protein